MAFDPNELLNYQSPEASPVPASTSQSSFDPNELLSYQPPEAEPQPVKDVQSNFDPNELLNYQSEQPTYSGAQSDALKATTAPATAVPPLGVTSKESKPIAAPSLSAGNAFSMGLGRGAVPFLPKASTVEQATQQEHPWATMAGEVVGGLAGFVPFLKAAKAVSAIPKVVKALAPIVQSKALPTLGKFAPALLENILAFEAHDQVFMPVESNWKERAATAAVSLESAVGFTAAGAGNKVVQPIGLFAVGYGLAKQEGGDNQSAITAGLINAGIPLGMKSVEWAGGKIKNRGQIEARMQDAAVKTGTKPEDAKVIAAQVVDGIEQAQFGKLKRVGKDVPMEQKPVAPQQPPASETQAKSPELMTPGGKTQVQTVLPAASFFEAKTKAKELGVDTKGMRSKAEVDAAIKAKQAEPVAVPTEGQHEIQTVTRAGATEEALPLAQEARRTGAAFKENKPLQPIQDRLATVTPQELKQASQDKTNPERGLAMQERLARETTEEGRQSVFNEMVQDYSDVGFALRTAGEYLKSTPEGMLEVAKRVLKKNKAPMTPEQEAQLRPVAESDIQSKRNLRSAEGAYRTNPTTENEIALTRAEAQAEATSQTWLKANAKLQPKSVADTLFKIVQGHLLAPISHAYNFLGNLINQPVRGLVDSIAAAEDAVRVKVKGGSRTILNPLVGISEKIKAIKASFPEMKRILREGGGALGTAGAGEVHESGSPSRAWAAIVGKEKAPPNLTGTQRASWYVSNLLDGLTPSAEANFRLLAAMDAPFAKGEYAKQLHQIGIELGLKGEDLVHFKRLPIEKAKLQAGERAREAVYQADNPISDTWNFINKQIENYGGKWAVNAWKIGTGAIFVKTPANIAHEYMQLAMPPVAIAKGMIEARSGNMRAAEQSFARAIIGTTLITATTVLAKAGLFSARDKNAKERGLQYETQPPDTFNVTGYKRWMKGDNPQWQKGDKVINVVNMGFLGMMGNLAANAESAVQQVPEEDRTIGTRLGALTTKGGYSLLNSLTMLKGQRVIYEAINSERYDNYLGNLWNIATTIPIPNTISTIARSSRKNMIDTRMGNLGDTMVESLKAKIPGVEAGTLRRDMWGNSIPSTPEGANAFLYNFLDATKSRNIPDKPESREVWLIEHQLQGTPSAGKAIPSIPSDKITINKKQIKLTPQQHDAYTALVGKYRLDAVKRVTSSSSWSAHSPEVKAKILSKMYDQQAERAKVIMIREAKLLDQFPTII